MWTDKLSKIFVVNLSERTDRLLHINKELRNAAIADYKIVRATKHEDGREGLWVTMDLIFEAAIAQKWERILVFEDDAKIIRADFNEIMEGVMSDLPQDWEMIYLGCNPRLPFINQYNKYLLRIESAWSTHAVIYSRKGMINILSKEKILPIDQMFASQIHPEGNCYCAYPLLVSQCPGHSDIEGKLQDWDWVIQGQYRKMVQSLTGLLK